MNQAIVMRNDTHNLKLAQRTTFGYRFSETLHSLINKPGVRKKVKCSELVELYLEIDS